MGEEKRERIEIRRTKQGKTVLRISENEVSDYESALRNLTGALRVAFMRISGGKEYYSFSWNAIKTLIIALDAIDWNSDPLGMIAEKLCRNVKIVMDAFYAQDKKEDESYIFYI